MVNDDVVNLKVYERIKYHPNIILFNK